MSSEIEWTDETWNLVTGCDRLSPGCAHCYALRDAKRWKAAGNPRYQRDGDPRTSGPGFGVTVHLDLLNLPHHWQTPRRIFVNSMSDLFHEEIPAEVIEQAFAVMQATPRHTYQILTKRAERLIELAPSLPWPANVWMGVSVEYQRYCHRAVRVVRTDAALRFLSIEPLLGPVDLEMVLGLERSGEGKPAIQWVIAGGESGPRARSCEVEWLRSIRDQCVLARVPFFCKQLGSRWASARGLRRKGQSKGQDPTTWPADLRAEREIPV